ncbi:MAG TPA: efflux RND transporter periplasmic adaptor subunit [Dissulfurispiraceae bacterium]
MKRNSLIIIVSSLVLISGFLFLGFTKTGSNLLHKSSKDKLVQASSAQAQSASGGGGMAGMPMPSQPQTQKPAPEAQPEAAQEEAPTVEIPPDKQQLIGVKTTAAAVMPLRRVIRTVGRIEYDEKKLATVNTKFEGWIERLYVDYTGRYVKRGERLAEIYSPELYATQQEYLNVLKWAKQGKEIKEERISKMLSGDASSILEAAKQRLRLWDISEAQIRKIEETGKPVKTMTLYSPVSGYVLQKTVVQGMRVMPGEKLFDIADLSTVWIISDIYEYELPLVRQGQTATISLSYFPGKEWTSRIDYVYPTLAGETRTAKARFTISNPGGQLKPQMFTNVEVKINLGNRLLVPSDAVINTGTRQIAYVDKGEGYFEPREVTTGLTGDGVVEIVKGLKAGEKVASSANFLIDSESRLKGIVKE